MASVPILLWKNSKIVSELSSMVFFDYVKNDLVRFSSVYHVLFLLFYVAHVCVGYERVFNHHSEQARHRHG